MDKNTVSTKSLSDKQREEIYLKLFGSLKQFGERLQKEGIIHVDFLIKLEELIEFAKVGKLTHDMIHDAQAQIAQCLTECYPHLQNQLTSYWNAWSVIFDKVSPTPINIREKVDECLNDMDEIDLIYKEILKQNPETNDVTLYAIFYAHVLKTEKIEFPLKKDMDYFLKQINGFDTEMIFSVGGKMANSRKGTGFVTHGRAFRDALSHKKFKIESSEGKKYIIFTNNEYGYDFTETIEISEFLNFIKSTDMLYRMMFMMLNLIIMTTLLHESVASI